MDTDDERSSPISRSDSPETVFNNDFSEYEEETEVENGISDCTVPLLPICDSPNAETMLENLPDDVTYSKETEGRDVSVVEAETDGACILPSPHGGAMENTSPDLLHDQTTSKKNSMNGTKGTDVASKTKQHILKNEVNVDSLTRGWTLQENDFLCLPLVVNKVRNVNEAMPSQRHHSGKGKKTSLMRLLRKRSGKGSIRMLYVSPMTMIANMAKKKGYDLPTLLETSEFIGGPSLQLPCMQCYEKYGGKGGVGMDSMLDGVGGDGNSSNGKCLTCGGQVQTMASFGRMIRQMRDTIEKKGLVPHDVYPDGNCLFAAIVDQLRVRGDFTFTMHTLRQSAVDYLKENPTTEIVGQDLRNFLAYNLTVFLLDIDDGTPLQMFLTDEETWDAYLTRMSEDGEWGDHMILGALANVINMPIVIYGGTTGQNETILYPRIMTKTDGQELDDCSVVYLGHVGESHYMSLRPRSWRQTLQKSPYQRRMSVQSTPAEDVFVKCPTQHIDFILRQVFRMDFIGSPVSEYLDVRTPSRFETPEYETEMFGSFVCKLVPCKVQVDSFGPDISMYFPSVKEEENIDGCFENSANAIFNTPYDTTIVSTMTSAKATDLIVENATDVDGHLKLIPKNPKIWRGQTTSPNKDTTYLKAFEVIFDLSEESFISKLPKNPFAMYLMLAFKCSWPAVAEHWPHRCRESGFPDERTIQTVVENGCHVIPVTSDTRMSDILDDPVHFMTSVDDHTWCYSFAAAEKEICRFISSEQRQSFLVFKALVDITLKDIPLPSSIVKSIFFYACENIEKQYWKTKPGECLLIVLKKIVECLKNRHVQHYFMREKNLLNFIPEKVIEECYERLDHARLQPVVTLYFLLDQLNILSSEIGCFVEEIIEHIKVDEETSSGVSLGSHSLLPACTELIKDFIYEDDYQAAMLVFQDLVEEKGNSLETNGVDLIKKVLSDLHISYTWCFALYVDIKQKTKLSAKLCEGICSVHVTEVFGPDCIDELPDTLVPETFSISNGDLIFAEQISEILSQNVSGRMFIKCMKYYLKRYGELAGDSLILPASSSVTASITTTGRKKNMTGAVASMVQSPSLLLQLHDIYARLINFCDQFNMVEEFREMMPLYALIAERQGTQISLSNLANTWECLGEGKKAENVRGKMTVGKGGSTLTRFLFQF